MKKYLIEICPEGHEHPPADTGTGLQFCIYCGDTYSPDAKSLDEIGYEKGYSRLK
jgi:hypothetical protein